MFSFTYVTDSHADISEILSSSPALESEVVLVASHLKKKARRKKFKEMCHLVYHRMRQSYSSKLICEVREPKKNVASSEALTNCAGLV